MFQFNIFLFQLTIYLFMRAKKLAFIFVFFSVFIYPFEFEATSLQCSEVAYESVVANIILFLQLCKHSW